MRYYVHHVPGRLRVKVPVLRSRPGCATRIRAMIEREGVEEITINTNTGSVLIHYDPEVVRSEDLLQDLSHSGYFDHTLTIGIDESLHCATEKTVKKLGRALFGWGVGKALEESGLSLLAALI